MGQNLDQYELDPAAGWKGQLAITFILRKAISRPTQYGVAEPRADWECNLGKGFVFLVTKRPIRLFALGSEAVAHILVVGMSGETSPELN